MPRNIGEATIAIAFRRRKFQRFVKPKDIVNELLDEIKYLFDNCIISCRCFGLLPGETRLTRLPIRLRFNQLTLIFEVRQNLGGKEKLFSS